MRLEGWWQTWRHQWRYVSAIAISSVLVPHSFWRFVYSKGTSRSGSLELVYMAVVLVIVGALVWKRQDRHYFRGAWLALLGVVFFHAIITYRKVGNTIPWEMVYLLVLPWVLLLCWLAWLPAIANRRWLYRSMVAILGVLLLPSGLMLTTNGLTGDGKLGVMWRKTSLALPARVRPTAPSENEPPSSENRQAREFPFMGPHRDGVVPDVHLVANWQQHPPQELWRREIGLGWSTFAVQGDRICTMDKRGDDECTVMWELSSGKEIWSKSQPVAPLESAGGEGPRATPAFAGDRVISLGATGLLRCLQAETGAEIWFRDILHGTDNLPHGVAGSPLVLGENVYVSPAQSGGPCLACYDLDGGVLKWEAGQHRASYASPMLVERLGQSQILVYHQQGLASFDPESGAPLWEFDWTNNVETNAPQPILVPERDDQIVLATGYDRGTTLITLTRTETNWKAEGGWQSKRLKPKFSTPVIWRDQVIGFDNGILASIELKTGELKWKAGRYGFGELLRVGNHLLVISEPGDLLLVELTDGEPRELAKIPALQGKCWSHLAFAAPFLLVRNGSEAVCYRLEIE